MIDDIDLPALVEALSAYPAVAQAEITGSWPTSADILWCSAAAGAEFALVLQAMYPAVTVRWIATQSRLIIEDGV